MKIRITFLLLLVTVSLRAQHTTITLGDCIAGALQNMTQIKAAKTDLLLAGLQKDEATAGYNTKVSLAYDYRFNPIIPSQIVPIGQFSPEPTDETRAIQFGTKWQQTAGVSVLQPLLNLSVRNRINESKINEKIKNADLAVAENDLIYEVSRSFAQLFMFSENLNLAVNDTMETARALALTRSQYSEGKMLKSALNSAILNHRKALEQYESAFYDLLNEKVYMSFLSSIEMSQMLQARFDFEDFESRLQLPEELSLDASELPNISQIAARKELIAAQIQTENDRSKPTLNLQGYLGANQFTNTPNPFLSNTWFGNSYVGVSLDWPILSGEKKGNKERQLEIQSKQLTLEQEDLLRNLEKDASQSAFVLAKIRSELSRSKENILLLEENKQLTALRYSNAQATASELQQTELQLNAEKLRLNQLKSSYYAELLDYLRRTGHLKEYLL